MTSKKKNTKTEIEQAADDLYEVGEKYLEARSDEAVIDITEELRKPMDDVEGAERTEVTLKEAILEGETVYGTDIAEVFGGESSGVIHIPMKALKDFPYKPEFIYNRLASLDGYNGFGVHYRKDWEIEMALKTLHDLGGAHPNANILGVGAGTERTIFELANPQSAALVTATDIYSAPGVWAGWHGEKFLRNPHKFAPEGLDYDPARVAAMHVDMCDMPYDDEVYDAIFSSGSIEHVGKSGIFDTAAISAAAREIGRVLKKGGIASISTEFKVSGEGWGFGHVRLFSKEDILRYIVEPSGLELVGEVDWEYHGDLDDYAELADAVNNPKAEAMKPLLRHDGFLFTSIHLVLKKKA